MKRTLVCGLMCLGLAGAAQAAVSIDFENDALGYKPNGWNSVDSSLVSFSDSIGAQLQVYSGLETDGTGLAVLTDSDGSSLIMNFAQAVNSLSLDFGNDQAGFAIPGDQAILTVFLGGDQVGQTAMAMNLNDLMDQTIFISGVTFDSATLYYAATGQTNGLTEIVDNIQFEVAGATIPAPGAILLGTLGTGLVGWLRRHRSF